MRPSLHTHREPARPTGPGPTTARPSRASKAGIPAEIEALKADHVIFQKLLRVFESELALFHDGEKPVDYEIMRDVMHYVTNYPDRKHHPMEDLIFGRLLQVEPAARRPVEELQQEHEWLATTGTELLRLLDEIVADAMISRDSVESLARTYLQRLRAHMDQEEATLFPMAAERLSPEDWAALTVAGKRLGDPLFGGAQADQKYRAIRERLGAAEFTA